MAAIARESVVAGRYRLLQRLGDSPAGGVWLARDERDRVTRVLKFLSPGSEGPRDLESPLAAEFEALRTLRHPRIPPVVDVIREPVRGVLAVLFERVPGESLDRVAGHGALPRTDIARILVDVAHALGAIHRRSFLHRDLHPGNVMVSGGPGRRTGMLLDLGLATPQGLRPQGGFSGSIGYAAPEALLGGALDARTDLYALGALLYFMVTGESPVEPKSHLEALVRGLDPLASLEARIRERVPEPFRAIAIRLLSRYPASRYQAAFEVVEAVNLLMGTPSRSRPPTTWPPPSRSPRSSGGRANSRRPSAISRGVWMPASRGGWSSSALPERGSRGSCPRFATGFTTGEGSA
jgi:serine/threonine protein kinase